MNIYDILSNTRLSVSINEGGVYKKELMKEDYNLLKFSTQNPVYFEYGDYIINEFGRFELINKSNPKENKNNGGYDYELRFDAPYFRLKNFILFYDRQNKESSWTLTASVDRFLEIVNSNILTAGVTNGTAYQVVRGSDVPNTPLTLTFESENILDSITKIAEKLETEWYVSGNIFTLGRCEINSQVDFDHSVISEMDPQSGDTEYATRIYAFGSTRNIPTNYRPTDESSVVEGVVQKRLMLPIGTPYVDAYANMPSSKIVESIVVFDDIYPKRVGTMSNITTVQATETIENENGTSTQTFNAYRYKDSGLSFLNSYIIPGVELRIVFNSGLLSGLDFAVNFTESTQVFEIIRNEDYGSKLPNDVLKPVNGDTYVLYGYNTGLVQSTLIPNAEAELLLRAQEYVEKSKIDPIVYQCTTNPVRCSGYVNGSYLESNEIDLDLGNKVKLINSSYFETFRESRIVGFEKKLDNKFECVYLVGESSVYSRFGNLEKKIESVTYKGQTYTYTGENGVYVISRNDNKIPSDTNVFSALRSKSEFLSKKNPDTANEKITFKKGIIAYSQSGQSDSADGIVELEDGEEFVEESENDGISTIGGLLNVADEADTAESGSVLMKQGDHYVPDISMITNISELLYFMQNNNGVMVTTEEDGFFVMDENNNVVMQFTPEGFDSIAVTTHFRELLEAYIISSSAIKGYTFVDVEEEGLYFVDENYNAGLSVTASGLDAGALTPHFRSLIGSGGGGSGSSCSYLVTDYNVSVNNTNNNAAFQALIDLVSAAGGGEIVFPSGVFNFVQTGTGKILYMKDNVTIKGSGFSTVLRVSGHSPGGDSLFYYIVSGFTKPIVNCHFRDLMIDQTDCTTTGYTTNGKAIFFQDLKDCSFKNIILKGSPASALGIDYLRNVVIDGIQCINSGRKWTNGNYGGAGIGIGSGLYEDESFQIVNNICDNCGQYGIFIEAQNIFGHPEINKAAKANVIANNIIKNGRNTGIGLRGGNCVNISGNIVYKNAVYGIYMERNCNIINVDNNIVQANASHGICLAAYSTAPNADNYYQDSVKIGHNNVNGNGGCGIKLYSPSASFITNPALVGNTIKANTSYGIYIQGVTVNLFINGNNTAENQLGLYESVEQTNQSVQANFFADGQN